jgi:hypothetical protein
MPVAGRCEIFELEPDEPGQLPVGFEDGQLTAASQDVAATSLNGRW